MKFVARGERAEWHERAMAALAQAGLSPRIALLVRTKEWTRLARLVDAMALRILASKSSKRSRYYDAALESLEMAPRILRQEGRAGEWEALASEIRSEHRRKSGFMPGFERLVAGRSLRGPSFAERARARWSLGAGGGRGAP